MLAVVELAAKVVFFKTGNLALKTSNALSDALLCLS